MAQVHLLPLTSVNGIYTVSEDEKWMPRDAKVGILIPAKEIRHIEFWEP